MDVIKTCTNSNEWAIKALEKALNKAGNKVGNKVLNNALDEILNKALDEAGNKSGISDTMCYFYNRECVPKRDDINELHVFFNKMPNPFTTGTITSVIKAFTPQQLFYMYRNIGDLEALGLDSGANYNDFQTLLDKIFGCLPSSLSAIEFTVDPYTPNKVFNYKRNTQFNSTFVYDCY